MRWADNPLMSSAAPAASPAERPSASLRRRARPGLTRRSGLQLLAGLLVAAGIPVIATVRILDANALRNERAHADSALATELQSASEELRNIADAADKKSSGDYPQLSAEYILQQNPDLVYFADAKCCQQTAKTVGSRPGWRTAGGPSRAPRGRPSPGGWPGSPARGAPGLESAPTRSGRRRGWWRPRGPSAPGTGGYAC